MGKILLTGDLHVQKGLRTNIVLSYLDYLEEYYFENKIDCIFILGDIFDRATNIKNDMFIPIFKKLYEMKNMGVKFYFIIGNHEAINIENDSIIEIFLPIGEVFKKTAKIELFDREITLIPYTKNEEDVPEDGDIVFGHISVADFAFDNAYHATEKNSFSRSKFENYSICFFNHFHRHQRWNNIVYVGAPFQQFKDEAGQSKGFIILDTDTENWEFIEYTEAPTYTFLKYEDLINLASMEFSNKFVCVEINRKIKDFAKLKYILYEKGAVEVIPIFEKNVEEVKVDKDISFNNNIEQIVRDTIFNTKEEGINNEVLLKKFDEVVKKSK